MLIVIFEKKQPVDRKYKDNKVKIVKRVSAMYIQYFLEIKMFKYFLTYIYVYIYIYIYIYIYVCIYVYMYIYTYICVYIYTRYIIYIYI